MRKITFLLFTILLLVQSNEIIAQLFVKGNTYIYNKGVCVFVKGDVELDASSNFYLRQEGQLLQGGTTLNGSNKGTGELSLFQEGTVNNYIYNYWCSPVGNVTAYTTGNRDFGITMLGVPTNTPTPTIGFNPITLTSGYNGFASPGAAIIASYWINTYSVPSNSYTGWLNVGAATLIGPGQGFTMKGTSGSDPTDVGEATVNNPFNADPSIRAQRYDFRGKPNDGDIPISIGSDLFTLAGNPYPSAIDLTLFLTDPLNSGTVAVNGVNGVLDGVAYFWEQDRTIPSHLTVAYRGGYGAFNGSSGVSTRAIYSYFNAMGVPISDPSPPFLVPIDRRFCPVGQGFILKGKTTGPNGTGTGTATMRNAYRVFTKEGDGSDPNLSHFERNANSTNTDYGFYDDIPNVAGIDYTQISKAPTPHIRINSTLNGNAIRQLALCFMPNALDGVDRADTENPEAPFNFTYDAYMVLNNSEFIHSTTSFDINKRFPIGFKNNSQESATFKVKVYEFVNFDGAQNVYLYDGATGLYHDIKDNLYEVVLSPGVYNNRFEITFTNNALAVNTNIDENFVIVQNNPNQLLSISNPELMDVKSVVLYDMGGKSIFNKMNLGSSSTYEFSTASLSDGVYIVKLTTSEDKSTSQKIVVKRKN